MSAFDYEDEYDEPEQEDCPVCGCPNVPMGQLGTRTHFCCRACGMGFSTAVTA